jgi:Sporulation and spore germination.
MTHSQQRNTRGRESTSIISMFVTGLLVIFLPLISACSTNQATTPPAKTATPVIQPQPTKGTSEAGSTATATSTPVQYHVKVYFSKPAPAGSNEFSILSPVNRTTSDQMVGTFAVQQLVLGPTSAEQTQGYYSQVQRSITGPSNCVVAGAKTTDFKLTLNKKGTATEQGTATIQFCRQLLSAGIGTDATIKDEVTQTLKQFSTIQKVVILTNDRHCFGDESGLDICLR